jgi:regulator of protease activity HflC (stomatin/prohibitin superfamily)
MAALIVIAVVVIFLLVVAARSIRVIPQARAGVVERLGRYSRTLEPGLTIVTPFVERVRPLVDLREQVVNFSPQSVITEDNVVVGSRPSSTSRSPTPARRPMKSPTRFRQSSS